MLLGGAPAIYTFESYIGDYLVFCSRFTQNMILPPNNSTSAMSLCRTSTKKIVVGLFCRIDGTILSTYFLDCSRTISPSASKNLSGYFKTV